MNNYAAKLDGPDFNYPKNVISEAEIGLQNALKAQNGNDVVKCMVQYGIAQSLISDDNMSVILKKIDETIASDSNADARALLFYFKGLVIDSYSGNLARSRKNAVNSEISSDPSEWDTKQCATLTTECCKKALEEARNAHSKKIGEYPDVIINADDVSARLCPTLFDFIAYKSIELVENENDKTQLLNEWKQANIDNEDVTIFIECVNKDKNTSWKEIYNNHKNNDLSGFALRHLENNLENYPLFLEYTTKFPAGAFVDAIQNIIAEIKKKTTKFYYKSNFTSADSITISAYVNNVNNLTATIYKVPDNLASRERYSPILLSQLKPVATKEVVVDGEIPFQKRIDIKFPPLPYGKYIALADFEGREKNNDLYEVKDDFVEKVTIDEYFVVSDIALFSSCTDQDSKKHKVFAVNFITGKPMKDVSIVDFDNLFNTLGKTNSDGYLMVSNTNKYRSLYGVLGDDMYHSTSEAHLYLEQKELRSFDIFSDLSIYRPGETINFSAILSNTTIGSRNVIANEDVTATLFDPNHKKVETKDFTTDEFGRISGTFTAPTDRMNGTFHIELKAGKTTGSRYFEVSEFKTSSFIVDFSDAKKNFAEGEPVEIKGKIVTYSGAPVANAEVKISISRHYYFWWWRNDDFDFEYPTIHVTTDEAGNFSTTLSDEIFVDGKYYSYSVLAECTDQAGETQSGKMNFNIGNAVGVRFLKSEIEHINEKNITLPIEFVSSDPSINSGECEYRVMKTDSTVVKEGKFMSNKPEIDLTSLLSSRYIVQIRTVNSDVPYSDAKVILYHNNEKESPVEQALWIPEAGRSATEKEAKIRIATSCDAYIYYIAASRQRTISEGWITYKSGFHDFKIDMPQGKDEFVQMKFYCANKGVVYTDEVRLESPNKDVLELNVESFRDKVGSGEREKWTFTLRDGNGNPVRGAMLLEMVNKAINDIQPNEWSLYRSYLSHRAYSISSPSYSDDGARYFSAKVAYSYQKELQMPNFNTYGRNLFYNYRWKGGRVLYSMAAPMRMIANMCDIDMNYADIQEEVKMKSVKACVVRDGSGAVKAEVNGTETALNNVELREDEVKTALWMPNITSNADGSVTVEFDTPNFNTTWLVQAVAYNSSLATAKWQKNMMTNKPIMVKANAPRFLRTGDITTMAASVQNVSDATQQVSAVIEVVNPRTNEVLSSKTYSLNIESMATEAVKINYEVPADLPFVALRVKAANATNGDGEQVMIPILTDISPVIETKPFYINAGEGTFSTEMPDMPCDSRVTLEYCDNPVWYCVTALPTILNENATSTSSLVHNLFALTLAKGIAESNPEIKTAVEYWTSHPQDSTLMSMLEKNKDLKIGTLLASPWINDAERQTLRMSKLNELFDNNIQSKYTNSIISKLQSLQLSNGGFKWFDCSWCTPSLWATGEVLEVIGRLRQLGYLTNDDRIEQMVKNALRFYDIETYAIFLRDKSKHPEYYSDYAYVRSMYPNYEFAGQSKDLYTKALKAMTTTWKDRAIADKAFYALALNRGGYPTVARNIMESVRQFAIVHPTRGMYWDNINLGSGRGFRKVTTTSFVLQAFREISYRTTEIDQIRKWMLLEKQSNDWGGSSLAADAVYSLMLTGTNWTRKGEMPQITIGGTAVEFDQMENYLGYGRRTISAATSGENLVINRGQSQSPAWGSVYCQYKGKMTNIESAKTDDISIEKEYLRYDENGNLSKADTFRVGDKVQVRCIIHTGKSAQYLTLTDERASCFEPTDKVSDGKVQDGVYYYLEVKDSSTNSFFYQLEKGTFVVGYDVYVTMPGTFTSGIATIQSQYAPQITAHSAGTTITVLP